MKMVVALGESDSIPKPEKLRSKMKGVSLGQDDEGFYVFTHRSRSKSYELPQDIPDSVIEQIESTG